MDAATAAAVNPAPSAEALCAVAPSSKVFTTIFANSARVTCRSGRIVPSLYPCKTPNLINSRISASYTCPVTSSAALAVCCVKAVTMRSTVRKPSSNFFILTKSPFWKINPLVLIGLTKIKSLHEKNQLKAYFNS